MNELEQPGLLFNSAYRERIELPDGRVVMLRLIRPSDKERLAEGISRMSEESLYSRFMGVRSKFSDSILRYFVDVDGDNHFALGATTVDAEGNEKGVATARFIRQSSGADIAEMALTVVDEFQELGLGRILFDRLMAAARERGIERFYAEFLSNNRRMRALLNPFEKLAKNQAAEGRMTMEFLLTVPQSPL
jgi:GNAT superfamily N-acetyltransferase